jgi:hypothetical protein
VLTAVVSAVTAFPAATLLGLAAMARSCEGAATDIGVTAGCVDDAASLIVLLESFATELLPVDLGGGNSSWETAMTMSERNKARKKRLSIQGTGS